MLLKAPLCIITKLLACLQTLVLKVQCVGFSGNSQRGCRMWPTEYSSLHPPNVVANKNETKRVSGWFVCSGQLWSPTSGDVKGWFSSNKTPKFFVSGDYTHLKTKLWIFYCISTQNSSKTPTHWTSKLPWKTKMSLQFSTHLSWIEKLVMRFIDTARFAFATQRKRFIRDCQQRLMQMQRNWNLRQVEWE